MGCPTHEPAGRAAISSPSRMSTTRARIRLRAAGNADRAAQAEVGFEPTNNGFAIRPNDPTTDEEQDTCRAEPESLGALLGAIRAKSPDLAVVIERWASLPAALKTGIVAMVNTAIESR